MAPRLKHDPKDWIGKKINKLTILEEVPSTYGYPRMVKCECDCGIIRNFLLHIIVNGKTKSCGCINQRSRGKTFHKVGPGQTGLGMLFKNYRYRAKKKNRNFNLTKEEFKELVTQKYHYCGAEPNQIYKYPSIYSMEAREYSAFKYNGLDRKDSNVGYIKENVVPCCWQCNSAKKNWSYEEFKNWLVKVRDYFLK